jgi:acyl dehydratase
MVDETGDRSREQGSPEDPAAASTKLVERVYLEDYEVGEVMVSPGRTITETDVVTYASLTGDWHPLHTNAVYAETTPFGERIAHGMMTLAIGSQLVERIGLYRYTPRGFIAFYGIDGVRFLRPVRLGDTLHSVNRVADLIPKDETRGVLHYKGEVVNQHDEVVMVWESRFLVARRPGA